ncbi:MAG: hypothetical protein ACRDNE_10475 [Gaiellaceae bacterium]
MAHRLPAFVLVAAAFLVAVSPAGAHREGKAEPRIAAGLSDEAGLVRTLTVRLADRDNGDPIRGATVVAVAEMTGPGLETPRVQLSEVRPALHRARITFLDAGAWRIRITVSGKKVVTAQAALPVQIEPAEGGPGTTTEETHGGGHGGEVTPLATTTDDELVQGDYVRMAALWIHGLAAMGWIAGVLVMAVALSTRPGVLAEAARRRLAEGYRRWGAWAHWSLVLVIVGTGAYNMLEVTPFPLAYTPSQWEELADVPYGLLYEGILIVKLALFVSLLNTGTMTLLRIVNPPLPVVPVSNPHPGFLRTLGSALGPAGVFYLATIPLILGAAMALRYVHVLSHAAGATSHG